MARGNSKSKRPRRRSRAFALLGGLEALMYANILTVGALGSNVVTAIFGSMNPETGRYSPSGIAYGQALSFRELVTDPSAFSTVFSNLQSNWFDMAWKSFAVGATFRVIRRVLSRPIRKVNSELIYPLAGKSLVRL
jgi:hypothetical protein